MVTLTVQAAHIINFYSRGQAFKDSSISCFSIFKSRDNLFRGARQLTVKHHGEHVLGGHPSENSSVIRHQKHCNDLDLYNSADQAPWFCKERLNKINLNYNHVYDTMTLLEQRGT